MRPKTRQEMANELHLSRSTFYRKLKEAGLELPRGLISPEMQLIICKDLGYPLPNSQNLELDTV